jgi:hypothetical protein
VDTALIPLQTLPEKVTKELDDKRVLQGQRRTGIAKKKVFILPDCVYKGPYEMNAKLLKFAFRSEVFKLLGSKVLLPTGFFNDGAKIYIAFANIASTAPDTWKGDLDVESDKLGGGFVFIVQRASMGIYTFAEKRYDEKFKEVLLALLDAFALGVGDTHFGNVLRNDKDVWLVDYEDDSHRDLDTLKLEDFLFKAPLAASMKEVVKKAIETHKKDLIAEIDNIDSKKDELNTLAAKYGVTLDLEKRRAVARKLLV